MLILIFLSISCLIYYGNAAGNSNHIELASADDTVLGEATVRHKRGIGFGGETEQDPNDPKYQKMAKELVLNHLRIKEEDTKNIKVNRVTTQVVAGIITRIEIKITMASGNSDTCNFQVWEKSWENVKHVTFNCLIQKQVLSGMSGKPRPEQARDPKDPKYHTLAKTSIDSLFQTAGNKPFKKDDIRKITVTNVKVKIGSKIMSYIQFNVNTVNNNNYQCASSVLETPWNPQETEKVSEVNCELAKGNSQLLLGATPSMHIGGEEEQDPHDPQYQQLAKESFQFYLKTHKQKVHVKRIRVDSVTTQVVAGTITRIHFRVYPTGGSRLDCHSNIFEELGPGRHLTFNVNCSMNIGGQEEQDPDDPQYQQLAKESFQFYLKTHKKNVQVKRIKVDSVTTQLVAGTITRIHFRVYPTRGSSSECQSKIFKKLGPGRHLTFNVNCSTNIGGQEEQDPDDPQYQQLAKESFQFYLKTHQQNVHVKRIKVDSVTTQVVAGTITRIHFRVYPTGGSRLDCHSNIFEELGPGRHLTFNVNCSMNIGGQEEQDPDDPQYQQLAKESFQFYLKTHKKNVQVKRIKVDSVTTQLVAGTITRIHFRVYPTRGSSSECQSKIFKKLGPGRHLTFNVNCSTNIGGQEEQDPDDPQYQQLAKESFQFYLKTHQQNVHVKRIKVDSVTTQVVAGTITRIHFRVYPTRGSRLDCQSNIFEELGPGRHLTFNVNCSMNIGGQEEQDPDDPQYQQLAKESFQFYLKTHQQNVHVKRIKVDSVTTQVVAGTITRIHFRVYPTRGSRLDCQSNIFEELGPGRHLTFNVNCSGIDGGEEEQDPDDPQYQQLAKESFRKYRETHIGPLFAIKEQRVTRATTQVVAGLITRLNFYVTTTEGGKYTCHSEIYERVWEKIKDIDVNCSFVGPSGNAKLALKLNSNSKRGNFASDAVEQYLEDEYKNSYLRVARSETRSIKIFTTRVSKQRITYYKVDAFAHVPDGDQSIFNCSVLFGSWFGKKPIATNCIKVNYLMGRSEWVDPMNKKYLSFAEKSLQLYLKNSLNNRGPSDYRKYDVIVTFVKQQLVAGDLNHMNFVARWVHGNDDDPTVLICDTEIWEKLDGKTDIPKAKCATVSWNIIS